MRLSCGPLGRLLIRGGIVLLAGVLLCVPALTRITQHLETTKLSTTPSFGKNIDCPPKKALVAPPLAITSLTVLKGFETVPLVRSVTSPDQTPPRSPVPFAFRPLRAPPSASLA